MSNDQSIVETLATVDTLPIAEILPAIQKTLLEHDSLVLEAPPGAGKTTGVPLALLDQPWLTQHQIAKKILMLEPRRLAAKAAACRMASVLGEKVGETVGYRIRLESKVSQQTRIEVVTEGILTRLLQHDPSLDDYALVIFDEFHERNLDADLGLALTLQSRLLFRDEQQPLKLLVMSATLNTEGLTALLGDCPMLRSEGRCYPVDIRYGAPWQYQQDTMQRLASTIIEAIEQQQGSLLVFLPGQGEIRRLNEILQSKFAHQDTIVLCPLYGDLSLSAQQQAIEPAQPGQRKIVLATSIAETSLTIEGVQVVIDSGLSRLPQFDPNSGMTRLTTQRVSRAASEQRAGRAGRTGPGICYRLWSAEQQQQLASHNDPEILQADLCSLVLQLYQWGVHDPADLDWVTPPPQAAYQQATELLTELQALAFVDPGKITRQLTEHGRYMAKLASHPRLAHMMLRAKALGFVELGSYLAALLAERDPLASTNHASVEIQDRLDLITGSIKPQQRQKSLVQRIRQQAKLFQQSLKAVAIDNSKQAGSCTEQQAVGLLLALAYPDRIAKQRKQAGNDYLLSNGSAAAISEHDPLRQASFLAAAEVSGHQGQTQRQVIRLAASLDAQLFDTHLSHLCHNHAVVDWQQQQLLAEQQRRLGALIIDRKKIDTPSAEQVKQGLVALICSNKLKHLPWSEEIEQLQARILMLRNLELEHNPVSQWPDVSTEGLIASTNDWLHPYLDNIRHTKHLKNLDLKSMLLSLLDWSLQQTLDKQAPSHWRVASGSRIRINYLAEPPVLAVKLQEMFGCTETPSIANGQIALQIHLLSPAQRPLQVTQDLVSFWRDGYQAVKKDMKGRYPKHPWPDDPFTAVATAKVKRKLQP